MELTKAITHIKNNRNKIKSIDTLNIIDYKLINKIIESKGKCKIKIADINYKNNIVESVYLNLDLDINYTSNYNEFFNDVSGLIDHKTSYLDAAFYDDVSKICEKTTHQDILDEIKEIEDFIKEKGEEYGLK